MTEAEWLACEDPQPMLVFLRSEQGKGVRPKWPGLNEKKERLFACACCRRIWHRLVDERSRRAVEVAERCADGNVNQEEIESAAHGAYLAATDDRAYDNDDIAAPEYAALFTIGVYDATGAITTITPSFSALNAAENTAASIANRTSGPEERTRVLRAETLAQATLFRDIFGNPFRPVTVIAAWLTSTVTSLAQAIYADRAFDRLPILADALEDAGCSNADILAHCRGGGEHVRGCWVVDLLLAKE
jgi:hypothetical protein